MGRLRQAQVALLVAACSSHDPPPPAPVKAVVADAAVPTIAAFPRLDGDPAGISAAIVDTFGSATARSCGVLDHVADNKAARACVAAALAKREPFVVEEAITGTDSGVSRALVGILDGTGYTVYAANYDSNPCGGGCADRGGTTVWKCPAVPKEVACEGGSLVDCFECPFDERAVIDSWHEGDGKRPDVVVLARSLVGRTPASVGPWLTGIKLGRPPAESVAILAQAGKLAAPVSFETEDDRRQLLQVRALVPGRCTTFRAQLAAMWGPSRDDSWLDPSAHLRAHLDRNTCALQFERYLDVDAWIGPDGVVPVAAIGKPMAELRPRSNRDDDLVEWRDAGLGRRGGPTRVSVSDDDRHKITSINASGATDAETINALRARMTQLFGKPQQDDTINDGGTRYTAWPTADLSVGVGSDAFEVSVNARQ